jgi:hypothetical protein
VQQFLSYWSWYLNSIPTVESRFSVVRRVPTRSLKATLHEGKYYSREWVWIGNPRSRSNSVPRYYPHPQSFQRMCRATGRGYRHGGQTHFDRWGWRSIACWDRGSKDTVQSCRRISSILIRIVVLHPSLIFSCILIVMVIPPVVVLLIIRSNALRFFPCARISEPKYWFSSSRNVPDNPNLDACLPVSSAFHGRHHDWSCFVTNRWQCLDKFHGIIPY